MKLARGGNGGEKKRVGSPMLAAFVFALTAALAALTWKGFPSQGDPGQAQALAKTAASLPERYAPLVISVSDAGQGTLRARISFRDLSGKELSVVERILPPGGLSLECWLLNPAALAKAGSAEAARRDYFLFPRRLRGAEEPYDGGLALFDAYSEGGFPAIFGGSAAVASDKASRKALSDVFGRIYRAENAGGTVPGPGVLPQGVKGLASVGILVAEPVKNTNYELSVARDGRLALRTTPFRP